MQAVPLEARRELVYVIIEMIPGVDYRESTDKLGALKLHPRMLFLTKLYKGRYEDLGAFDRQMSKKDT